MPSVLDVMEQFYGPIADYVTLLGPLGLPWPDLVELPVPWVVDADLRHRSHAVH